MRGFGFTFDIASQGLRQWYMGEDGVKRWLYSDEPCSVVERLDADFNKHFGLPKDIPQPDPIAEVETAEGMCGLPECGCVDGCVMCGEACDG